MLKYVNLETLEIRDIIKTAEEDNAKKIAKDLKRLGVSKNIISESTGLSEKEIDNL